MKALFFLTLCLLRGSCQPDPDCRGYSTSVVVMTQLLEIERSLIQAIESSSLRSLSLFRFFDEIKAEHEKSKKDLEKYLSNPLKSFALMRRLLLEWGAILIRMDRETRTEIDTYMASYVPQVPTEKDFTEAVLGIERIRKTYNLSITDMAEGRLNGVKNDARLSRFDLFAIGFELFKLNDYANAALWLHVSIVKDYQGNVGKSLFKFDPKVANQIFLESVSRIENLHNLDSTKDFDEICRGENLNLTKESCRYSTTWSPFYNLAPMKMEQLSMDPHIVIYHDVLTNNEIDDIKNKARPHLQRKIYFNKEQNALLNNTGTFQIADVILDKEIIQKIGDVTGLDSAGFETSRVFNYGLGGHCNLHTDFLEPMKDLSLGNRIATILLYLNEVEQGGETVFPTIGLSVTPHKGSLLLIYNIKNSGSPDWNTLHGSCPVIFGSKWVLSIWVREGAQVP